MLGDTMESLLYQKEYVPDGEMPEGVAVFTPTIGRFAVPGERISIKAWLVRASFWLMTGGKFRIFYIRQNGEIAHTSCVIPGCFKFPFLGKGEYSIGPCVTKPEFRGRGLYGKALRSITTHPMYQDGVFYMSVNEHNAPSIRGIEKAGFRQVGKIRKMKILKRYYRY